jgi:hypothetical protein
MQERRAERARAPPRDAAAHPYGLQNGSRWLKTTKGIAMFDTEAERAYKQWRDDLEARFPGVIRAMNHHFAELGEWLEDHMPHGASWEEGVEYVLSLPAPPCGEEDEWFTRAYFHENVYRPIVEALDEMVARGQVIQDGEVFRLNPDWHGSKR